MTSINKSINELVQYLNGTALIQDMPFSSCKLSEMGKLVFLSELHKRHPYFPYKLVKDRVITADVLNELSRQQY